MTKPVSVKTFIMFYKCDFKYINKIALGFF